MVKKSYIKDCFKTIKSEDVLNLESELNWGFYFSHREKELLNIALNHNILSTYDFIEIVCCDDLYYLQIAKNELHTEETLFVRCYELYKFSKELGIDTFHGFDVDEIYIVKA